MSYKDYDNRPNQTNSLPSFFSLDDAIQTAERKRIFKNKHCSFEEDVKDLWAGKRCRFCRCVGIRLFLAGHWRFKIAVQDLLIWLKMLASEVPHLKEICLIGRLTVAQQYESDREFLVQFIKKYLHKHISGKTEERDSYQGTFNLPAMHIFQNYKRLGLRNRSDRVCHPIWNKIGLGIKPIGQQSVLEVKIKGRILSPAQILNKGCIMHRTE
jgi:hypothetical protein